MHGYSMGEGQITFLVNIFSVLTCRFGVYVWFIFICVVIYLFFSCNAQFHSVIYVLYLHGNNSWFHSHKMPTGG